MRVCKCGIAEVDCEYHRPVFDAPHDTSLGSYERLKWKVCQLIESGERICVFENQGNWGIRVEKAPRTVYEKIGSLESVQAMDSINLHIAVAIALIKARKALDP